MSAYDRTLLYARFFGITFAEAVERLAAAGELTEEEKDALLDGAETE